MAASTQRPGYKGTNVTWRAFGDGTSTGTKGSEVVQVRGWPLNRDVLPLNIKGGPAAPRVGGRGRCNVRARACQRLRWAMLARRSA